MHKLANNWFRATVLAGVIGAGALTGGAALAQYGDPYDDPYGEPATTTTIQVVDPTRDVGELPPTGVDGTLLLSGVGMAGAAALGARRFLRRRS